MTQNFSFRLRSASYGGVAMVFVDNFVSLTNLVSCNCIVICARGVSYRFSLVSLDSCVCESVYVCVTDTKYNYFRCITHIGLFCKRDL